MEHIEKYIKKIGLEELDAVAGGVLDEDRKERLISAINVAKLFRLSKEACLDAHRRNGFTEEDLAFNEANW